MAPLGIESTALVTRASASSSPMEGMFGLQGTGW